MHHLADWLGGFSPRELTPELVSRVVAFARWCEDQPRGDNASTDIYTVLAVGFYERLFGSETTRLLLPKLVSRDDMLANAAYLASWVSADDYQKVLSLYDKGA